jgi:hypothetical protein
MLALVFCCATISTVVPKNSLLPVWSAWVWVLMMRVTGLSVTVLILSRMAWPVPGFLVSTRVTPPSVRKSRQRR